jgi:hypothetical protein
MASPETVREQILSVIELTSIIEPDIKRFTSIIVTGHSDRQDRSDMNCDQRGG